ncbi:GDP-fucose transporter 1 [Lepeophtheirus salmonis]|uniref:GDP-fucose transporter n=1 Tax=Lepeophtheirus salmonis TaxID=72036 RepID=C1BTQ7_LEPSM|nr:GDP-fucose transporter 1-like [Lepeophtheirus salmonis]ACO12410.1 GDP-fucose transporter [Lepeophtheirus salmonis]ADD24285.1 GDP-fucose transporter [Lepeophtheirus salmonis]
MEDTLLTRYIRILIVVVIYWVVSISLVFCNKALLSGSQTIDAPFFVTWYQCVITFFGCYAVLCVQKQKSGDGKSIEISFEKSEKILPLSLVFVSMITFNNLCLKNVGVSFYYIGRSLTTVFNVLFTYFLLGEKTSVRAVGCCCLIIFGFLLGVNQESEGDSFSLSGTVFGVLASLFVCLNSIYTKKILPEVDGSIWSLQMYNNLNAIVLFVPLMLIFGEFDVISSYTYLYSLSFWGMMSVGGILGLAIGYVTGLQIKITSPLTHNISGTAKSAVQTVMATQFSGEMKTNWWWGSNAIVLGGSALYAYVRNREMASKIKPLPSTNKI